jgi:glycosyltransferase involved in cell wall biosynthesis
MPGTVLIVSYYFPPSGGAGVQRVLKFVKYLPSYGWKPVVLTVPEDADFPARDPSLFAEIPPEAEVHRARILEPYRLYRKWTGRSKDVAIDIAANAGRTGGSGRERLAEWIRSTFFIPDARRFWKGPAVAMGSRLLSGGGIDLILSSAPPYTCHLIGRDLARRFRIPWIADFRDSWVGWLSAPKRRGLADIADRRLERAVLSGADRILTVSEGVRDDLLSRSPDVPPERLRIIPNGFDAADFEGLVARPARDAFVLTYTGSMYGKRNPLPLLEAAKAILKGHPEWRGGLKIRFIGRIEPSTLEAFRTLGGAFEHVPYVPHRESLQAILDSTALLLVIDEAPSAATIVTGKVYEYIGSGKPVLALGPDGEAARMIRSLDAGAVVAPGDAAAVETVLTDWIRRWRRGESLPAAKAAEVKRYERKAQTAELVKLFETLAPSGR